jgi:hypothetical protein
VRTIYYLNLTAFLLLAACGGAAGAVMSAVLVIALIAPLIVVIFERHFGNTDVSQSMVVIAAYIIISGSFLWALLKTYTYLIRRFW